MGNKGSLLRFILVGLVNTLIDFGLLLWLTSIGLPLLGANTIATGVALTFSFVANKKFTFRSDGNVRAQVAKFLAVTLVGLWILQPVVLCALLGSTTNLLGSQTGLIAAKVAATIVSMTWNYVLYKKVVFNGSAR